MAAWNRAAEVLDPLSCNVPVSHGPLGKSYAEDFATATPSGLDASNSHARYFGGLCEVSGRLLIEIYSNAIRKLRFEKWYIWAESRCSGHVSGRNTSTKEQQDRSKASRAQIPQNLITSSGTLYPTVCLYLYLQRAVAVSISVGESNNQRLCSIGNHHIRLLASCGNKKARCPHTQCQSTTCAMTMHKKTTQDIRTGQRPRIGTRTKRQSVVCI